MAERSFRDKIKETGKKGGIIVAGAGAITLLFAPGIGAVMLLGGAGAWVASETLIKDKRSSARIN